MTATEKTDKKPAAKKTAAAGAKPAAHKKPAAPKKAAAPRAKKAEKAEEAVATPEITAAAPTQQPAAFVAREIGTENFYAVGKRKTAVAQVIISAGSGKITVNELPVEGYFGTSDLQGIVARPLNAVGLDKNLTIRGKVHGGGIHAQAEAMRHAITRAIVALDPDARRTLKKLGFLTRDPRVKERKKPGLRRARRAPQFSKR
jgi:small subunit ribosomal protein S9